MSHARSCSRQTDRLTDLQRQIDRHGHRYNTRERADLQTQAKTDACCIRLQHIAPCVLGLGPETAAAKTGFNSGRVCSTPGYWAFGTPPDWAVECEQEMGGHGIYSAVPKGKQTAGKSHRQEGSDMPSVVGS